MNGENEQETQKGKGFGGAGAGAAALLTKLPLSFKLGILGGVAFFFVFLMIIAVIGALLSSVEAVLAPNTTKIEGKIDEAKIELRERIDRVAQKIKSETGVDMDRPLLVSTLVYDGDLDSFEDDDIMNKAEDNLDSESGKNWLLSFGESILDKIANLTDTYLGTAFTKKGKELKRWRRSERTIYSIAIQMVNETKLDLDFYKQNLIKNIIPNYYYDQLSETNPAASAKQIANDIFELAELYRAWFEEESGKNVCGPLGTCTYDIMGETVSNIQVDLINCEGTKSNYQVLATIPLEDYVLGIVNAEVGSGSDPEVLKAQAVIARTFALVRQYQMCPNNPSDCFYGYNPTTKKVRIRACEADQVYCDPKKDCYRLAMGRISRYSPEVGPDTPGASLWAGKRAMTEEEYSAYVEKLNPAKGKIALNTDGSIANVNFYSTQQVDYARLAKDGLDYTEIILKIHNGQGSGGLASAISQSRCASTGSKNCSPSGGGATGEFKNWKQLTSLGATWGDVPMGGSNINRIGCLATSIAIQAANSGAATGSDFNPGTFVKACTAKGVIDSSGNMYHGRVHEIIPGFKHVYAKDVYGTSRSEKIKIAKEMLADSCYPVMEVKGAGNCSGCGQHWVAVDYVSDNEIYMMDPASNETGVFAKYGNNGASINCYKRG